MTLEANEFRPRVRKRIIEKSGGECAYCHEKPSGERRITVHHKIPRSLGGTRREENGVPLCKPGCHDFFDALALENGVSYDEYVAETERLRRKNSSGNKIQ